MASETSPSVSLPGAERILLGPGPSPVSPRVMRAMVAPVLSHLDPDMLAMLDDVRGGEPRTHVFGVDRVNAMRMACDRRLGHGGVRFLLSSACAFRAP